jgi:hypothetical protein
MSNVQRQTRTETRKLMDFCWTSEVGLTDTSIANPYFLFYVDRDLAIDQLKYNYATKSETAGDDIKFGYASALGGTVTDLVDGAPVTADPGADLEVTFPDTTKALIVPAGSWFVVEADTVAGSNLAGLRVFVQGRLGVHN